MKTFAHTLLVLALSALLATSVSAQEKKKKPEGAKGGKAAAAAIKLPPGIELSAEQQAKVEELNKQYGPRLQELAKKSGEILSPEQRKARKEAGDAAKAEGKKGKEVQEAVDAALKLSDEQKKQLDDVQAQQKALQAEIRGKLEEILTAEQKAKLPGAKGAKGAKGTATKQPGQKKPGEKKPEKAGEKNPEKKPGEKNPDKKPAEKDSSK